MKVVKIAISEISPPTSTSGQRILQQAITQWLIKELSLKQQSGDPAQNLYS